MTLKAADLTARIETRGKIDAMCEIIDACTEATPPLVLLKGISTCTQYYPEPHLRSMADIDVLVEERFIGAVESVLYNLEYSRPSKVSSQFYQTHHHTAPFYHPRRDVWVEIHRRLLPRSTKSTQSGVFSLENVAKELRLSQFQGRAVRRLSDELQIIYTSAHWAQQLQTNGGLMAMLDIVYIIKHAGHRLDWSKIIGRVKLSPAAIEFCLLLAYLAHHEVVAIETSSSACLFSPFCSIFPIDLSCKVSRNLHVYRNAPAELCVRSQFEVGMPGSKLKKEKYLTNP